VTANEDKNADFTVAVVERNDEFGNIAGSS